jgi:sulfur carrier protein ThiS
VIVRHGCLPGYEVARCEVPARLTVARALARTGWRFALPTICVVNGAPLPRARWAQYRVREGDHVLFLSRPGKGGSGTGKQIAGLLGLIALAAFAPWAAGALLGTAASTVLFGGLTLGGLVSAGIMLGGALLISSLTAPKAASLPSTSGSADQIQQLYSVAASGNTGKLFGTIAVGYGRLKEFPAFAATPWQEYDGNDQYLNVLLSVGCGKYSYENLYVDDTILWDSSTGISDSFSDVSVAFYDPGESVTLFPVNVTQSVEVASQAITQDAVGPYVASAAGATATALAVDLVFPSGCFKINNSNGDMSSESVTVLAEFAPVDGAGALTGSFSTLFEQTFTYTTRNPQRVSVKTTVASGRYTVRVSRTDAPLVSSTGSSGYSGSNDVVWAGLRGFLDGPTSFDGVSTVAIRMKANNQLNQSSAHKFGVLRTRVLPVWNGSALVEAATRNPYWALYDMATSTDYGARRPASKIDFQAIVDGAAGADARGDTFDYTFNAPMLVPEAFDAALKVTRARHRWAGDILTCVRDEAVSVPQMLLTDREIVRGSLSVDYALNSEDQSDSVVLQYVDENTWAPANIQYPQNSGSFTASNPATIQIDGIVNRDQAYRETAFYYQQAYYRRTSITLDTEHDGRLLSFGAHVRVQSEMPQSWGYGGVVTGTDVGNVLLLDPAPDWSDAGQKYIEIRTKTGDRFGPVKCSEGASADRALLDGTDLAAVEASQSTTLAAVLERLDGADDPSFVLGVASKLSRDCIILSGQPNGDRVTLALVVDDANAYLTDGSATPANPSGSPLTQGTVPVIAGLTANFHQGNIEPILDASWFPAAGAVYYTADVSYDSGESWVHIYEGGQPTFSAVCNRANLRLRVAGVGPVLHGGFTTADVTVPEITAAVDTVTLESFKEGLRDYVTTQFAEAMATISSTMQKIAAAAGEQDAQNWLDKYGTRTVLAQQASDIAAASVEASVGAKAYTDSAIASYDLTVAASFADTNASVEENATAVATLDGYAAAAYAVTLDVNGYITGTQLINGGPGSSVFTVDTDYFQIARPGVGGGSPTPVFEVGTVGGDAQVGIRGNIMLDGTITADAISVATLSAISADFGSATYSGSISSASGKMIMSCTGNYLLIAE